MEYMEDFTKYDNARKRMSNVPIVSDYCNLLRDNLYLDHFEEYKKNEMKWMNFFTDSVKIGEFILPVLFFGDFSSIYQEMKYCYDKIENDETVMSKIGIKEIHLLNCYARFMCLCDMVKRFGEFDKMCKKIIIHKKRTFYELKKGDIIYIKVKRNIGEKHSGFTIRRKFDEWIESKVINVQIEKEKIQAEYGKRWFSLADYPEIIITTKNEDFYKSNRDIWDIEHGKDELFNFLKNNYK